MTRRPQTSSGSCSCSCHRLRHAYATSNAGNRHPPIHRSTVYNVLLSGDVALVFQTETVFLVVTQPNPARWRRLRPTRLRTRSRALGRGATFAWSSCPARPTSKARPGLCRRHLPVNRAAASCMILASNSCVTVPSGKPLSCGPSTLALPPPVLRHVCVASSQQLKLVEVDPIKSAVAARAGVATTRPRTSTSVSYLEPDASSSSASSTYRTGLTRPLWTTPPLPLSDLLAGNYVPASYTRPLQTAWKSGSTSARNSLNSSTPTSASAAAGGVQALSSSAAALYQPLRIPTPTPDRPQPIDLDVSSASSSTNRSTSRAAQHSRTGKGAGLHLSRGSTRSGSAGAATAASTTASADEEEEEDVWGVEWADGPGLASLTRRENGW
jgi:hypothetical protein